MRVAGRDDAVTAIRLVPELPVGPTPKVSVLVTTYNHENFLRQALESALSQQTTFPFEIVVGEDCSTDGTRELLQDVFASHPQTIRMVLPEQNLGPNQMYLEVMRAARGDYFAILDGDDYWTSTDKLHRQVEFLEGNARYEVCFHDVLVVTEGSDEPPRPGMPALERDTYELDDLLLGNFVPAASIMHRRVDVEGLPDWFTGFAWIDWLMLVLCAQRGRLRYLPGLSGVYRVHATGLWSSADRMSQLDEELRVYQQLEAYLPTTHAGALQAGVTRCRVQRAVEHLGLPSDRPIAVLSQRPALPWYFNGRAVHQLPSQDGLSTDGVLGDLLRMRRRSGLVQRSLHWRAGTPEHRAAEGSVYCVIVSSTEWFQRLPGLQAHFDQFRQLPSDEAYDIFEIPGQVVSEHVVASVRLGAALAEGLVAGHVDSPRVGHVTPAGLLDVRGWALFREGPAAEVLVMHEARVLARARTQVLRPDLAAAFPERRAAGTAGFLALIDLALVPEHAELIVAGLPQTGEPVVLARIRVEPKRLDIENA